MRQKIPLIMTYLNDNNIDMFFAQETWVRKCDGSIIKEIEEYNYKFISYRKSRKVDLGGGVGVVYKNNLKVTVLKRNYNFKSFEHICCKVLTVQGPILFLNLYRPEYTTKYRFAVNNFLEEFVLLLQELSCNSLPCIVLGDFNLHFELLQKDISMLPEHLKVKKKNVIDFCSIIHDYGFSQLVNEPTHEQNGTLDFIIVQNPLLINNFNIGVKDEVCNTDHYPVHITLNHKPCIENKKITIKRRYTSSIDSSIFVEELEKTDVQNKIANSTDPNEVFEFLISSVSTVLDKICPIETKTVKHRPNQKWFTAELQDLKRTRRRVERKYLKCPSVQNHLEHLEMQRVFRSASRSARGYSYAEVIQKNRNDLKKLYRTVNDLLGDGVVRTLPSCKDNNSLAEDMGNFFSNKIKKISVLN